MPKDVQREEVHDTQCRLRDAGVGHGLELRLLFFPVQGRSGEDPVGQQTRNQIRHHRVGFLEHPRAERSILRELPQHARILSALTREQDADRVRFDRRRVAQVDPRAILDAVVLREGRE